MTARSGDSFRLNNGFPHEGLPLILMRQYLIDAQPGLSVRGLQEALCLDQETAEETLRTYADAGYVVEIEGRPGRYVLTLQADLLVKQDTCRPITRIKAASVLTEMFAMLADHNAAGVGCRVASVTIFGAYLDSRKQVVPYLAAKVALTLNVGGDGVESSDALKEKLRNIDESLCIYFVASTAEMP